MKTEGWQDCSVKRNKSVSIQFEHHGPPHPIPLPEEREHLSTALEDSLNRELLARRQTVHPLLGERDGVRGTDASDCIVRNNRARAVTVVLAALTLVAGAQPVATNEADAQRQAALAEFTRKMKEPIIPRYSTRRRRS